MTRFQHKLGKSMQTSMASVLPGGALYLPGDAPWWTRLRVGVRAIQVLAKAPDDCFAAPALHLSMDRESFERVAGEMRKSPEGRALLAERPSLQASAIDLDALRSCDHDSLGSALTSYYEQHQIAPFDSPYPVRCDVEYLATRYREIHDVVHLVTGYGVDAVGELELQAFILGNLGLRQCVLAILFTAVVPPPGVPAFRTYRRRLLAAYRRGRQSGDVAIRPRYEQLWQLSLEEVRRRLALAPAEPVPAGA